MDIKQRLTNYFKAAFPGVAINTTEETRVLGDILEAAKSLNKGVAVWSCTEGLKIISPSVKDIDDTEDVLDAFKHRKKVEDTIFIMRDLHKWNFKTNPPYARALRDFLMQAPAEGNAMVILSPGFVPDTDIEKYITIMEYGLPSTEDLKKVAQGIADSVSKPLEINEPVLRALGGLATSEAENALALSVIETGDFNPDTIYREKVQQVKKTGLLEIIEADPAGMENIGGLENLKEWIDVRKRAYTPEAEEYGLTPPKGVLLVGVPGSGKSLSAKAFGTALGVPTVKLDIGNLFNSLVGESEARTRDALQLAEAMAPCVLWIDEIDKGFAGSTGSGSGDSGVTRRVFGNVISWMQERKRPVFMVATANQVQHLPPELLRKGRFDEIFAVDLPNDHEREMIFKIHLQKRGRDASKFDLATLSKNSNEFTGSEIEVVIDEAMFNAFSKGNEVGTLDIVNACNDTTPLSRTAKEQIDGIREWAKTRARFASKQETKTPETNTSKRKLS